MKGSLKNQMKNLLSVSLFDRGMIFIDLETFLKNIDLSRSYFYKLQKEIRETEEETIFDTVKTVLEERKENSEKKGRPKEFSEEMCGIMETIFETDTRFYLKEIKGLLFEVT